jgi:hypothetical protein
MGRATHPQPLGAIIKDMRLIKKTILTFSLYTSICFCSYSQDFDCYFTKDYIIEFKQNELYKKSAFDIISHYKLHDSLLIKESLLKGVSLFEIIEDVKYMINNPNSTNLNEIGYYCGIVVVLNWLLNNRPDIYAKSVLELTTIGSTKLTPETKRICLPSSLINKVNLSFDEDNFPSRKSIGDISISDFILGVSIVYNEKYFQRIGLLWKNSSFEKNNYGNFIFSNTMPWEIDNYFKKFGITDFKKSYYPNKKKKLKIIERLEEETNNGRLPIVFENHLITSNYRKNYFYKIFGAHYITIHSIKLNKECQTISISYWDYGSVKNHRKHNEKINPFTAKSLESAMKRAKKGTKIQQNGKNIEISIDQFIKGLKGYWIPN